MEDSKPGHIRHSACNKAGKIAYYEKRFGFIAIEKGYINCHDLVRALKIQVEEDMVRSSHRLIGEILFSLGLMTSSQVEDVLSDLFTNEVNDILIS